MKRLVLSLTAAVLAFVVAGATYLFGVKHFRLNVVRELLHVKFVRDYLFDEKFRRVAGLMNDEHAQSMDVFPIVLETKARWMMSRRLFRSVEMYGVPKYMYNPGLKKLLFTIEVGGLPRSFEMVDTPDLRRELADLQADNVRSTTYDRFGFRRVDAELTRDCAVRVMFLGDSFTDGVYVDDAETFVNRYGHLARERGRLDACPIDTGVDGYGTHEEAYVFEHYWEAVGRPGVAVLAHFPDDVDEDYWNEVIDGTLADASSRWAADFAYLRRITAFARAHGVALAIAAIPLERQAAQPATRRNYQDILRRFCEEEGVRFIDLLDTLNAYDPDEIYLKSDVHWTATGHRVVADALYERTKDLLAAASTSAASPPQARTKP